MSEDFLPTSRSGRPCSEGHFLLSSGTAPPRYVQCARVLMEPALASPALRGGSRVPPGGADRSRVGGGGARRWAGCWWRTRWRGRSGCAGSSPSARTAPWCCGGASRWSRASAAVVVEDVITTGGSTREVMDAVRGLGGVVEAVGCLIDRSGGVDLGVPLPQPGEARRPDVPRRRLPAVRGRRRAGEARISARDALTAGAALRVRSRTTARSSRLAGPGPAGRHAAAHGAGRAGEGAHAAASGVPVRVSGAGRTDAGVHALGQVASFDLPRRSRRPSCSARSTGMLRTTCGVLDAAVAAGRLPRAQERALQALPVRGRQRARPAAHPAADGRHVRWRLDARPVARRPRSFSGAHDFAAGRSSGARSRPPCARHPRRTAVLHGRDARLRGRGRRLPAQDGAEPGGGAPRGRAPERGRRRRCAGRSTRRDRRLAPPAQAAGSTWCASTTRDPV
jgi:orotate phosphoribosyltransferase